jgi:hypothetical protein
VEYKRQWSRGSSDGIVTGYGKKGPVSIPGSARFSNLHSVQAGSGAHLTCYFMCTEAFFRGWQIGRNVKLITHHHLVPRSRMAEVHTQLPVCFQA